MMAYLLVFLPLILALLVFLLARRGVFPRLKPTADPRSPVERLQAETEKEKAKTVELQAQLDAKQELLRTRVGNADLRRRISKVNEKNIAENDWTQGTRAR